MTASGHLLVIEGIDFAGKTTQIRRLNSTLLGRGWKTKTWHYPSDDTKLGRFIRRILDGKEKVPKDTLFALFAANRLESREAMEDALSKNNVVICDRYSPSELAYGCASGLPLSWLEGLESRMPQANLTFLLDLPASDAVCRSAGRKRDIFERKAEFLEQVRNQYLDLARLGTASNSRWCVIDATEREESVADEIVRQVTERLG